MSSAEEGAADGTGPADPLLGTRPGARRPSLNGTGDSEVIEVERVSDTFYSAEQDREEVSCCNRCIKDARRRGFVLVKAGVAIMIYMGCAMLAFAPWGGDGLRWTDTAPGASPWYVTALYFAVTTLTTVGYGDVTPATSGTQIFVCVYAFIGIGYILYAVVEAGDFLLAKQAEKLRKAIAEEKTGIHSSNDNTYLFRVMSLLYALALITGSLALGTVFFLSSTSDKSVIESFYLACMTSTTVGYGDQFPNTLEERAFACGYMLLSTLMVAYGLSLIVEVLLDVKGQEREENMRIMLRKVTVEDITRADTDGSGSVSQDEFCLYKLIEMGKITKAEVESLRVTFNKLDRDGDGNLTTADLRILPGDRLSKKAC